MVLFKIERQCFDEIVNDEWITTQGPAVIGSGILRTSARTLIAFGLGLVVETVDSQLRTDLPTPIDLRERMLALAVSSFPRHFRFLQ